MNTPSSKPWWKDLSRDQWFVFLVSSLAWLFDSVDLQVFNLARDGAVESLLQDPKLANEFAPYTTSIFLVGWAIGGLIFGALGDRYGRAKMLTVTVLMYSVCTGLSAFATSYAQFCFYRVITGVGVGGVFGLAVGLITDTVPNHTRAPALGLMQGLSTWGNIGAGFLGMAVGMWGASHALPLGLQPWQILFLAGALPAVLSIFIFRKLREPQAWVEARAKGKAQGIHFGSYGHMLGHPKWRRHAWFGLVLCCAGIIGLWGVGNFHPKIIRSIVDGHLLSQGLTAAELASEKAYWSSLGLVLQNIGGFFGMMVFARLAERWGRKKSFAVAYLLAFGFTVLVFTSLRELWHIYWMLPLMGFGQLSVFCLYAIYLPELFPPSLRSTGTSFCYNFGRLIAATAPFTLGVLTKKLGGDIESFRHAGLVISLVLLTGIMVLPFLPETKGQPLPEEDLSNAPGNDKKTK